MEIFRLKQLKIRHITAVVHCEPHANRLTTEVIINVADRYR